MSLGPGAWAQAWSKAEKGLGPGDTGHRAQITTLGPWNLEANLAGTEPGSLETKSLEHGARA
jgi:hypothetical protein